MKMNNMKTNNTSFNLKAGAVSIVLTGLMAALVPSLSFGETPQQAVTFTKDVAPILQRSCENCHRANGVAPMPLTTYEETRPWAASIKRKTAGREMPPWFIEKNIGVQRFKDDPSLSDAEIETIAKWVDSGASRGNPADMPPARRYTDGSGWLMGTPDLIVSTPVMPVKARGADWHGEIGPFPTGLMEDRYVQSVEFKEVRVDGPAAKRLGGKEGDLNYFSIHHSGLHEVDPDGTVRTSSDGLGGGFYLVHELGRQPHDLSGGDRRGAEGRFVVPLHDAPALGWPGSERASRHRLQVSSERLEAEVHAGGVRHDGHAAGRTGYSGEHGQRAHSRGPIASRDQGS